MKFKETINHNEIDDIEYMINKYHNILLNKKNNYKIIAQRIQKNISLMISAMMIQGFIK